MEFRLFSGIRSIVGAPLAQVLQAPQGLNPVLLLYEPCLQAKEKNRTGYKSPFECMAAMKHTFLLAIGLLEISLSLI